MDISKPQIIFCSEQPLENIDKVLCSVGYIKDIVVFASPISGKHIPFKSILQNKANDFQPFDGDCKDLVAAILCSSGTTGLSKGVILTHRNILHASRVMR
jgi:long-subunit acyl-CoA synthetase (AMP-forming)